MIAWLQALGPALAVGLIFYFVIGRMWKKIDLSQSKEMCIHVQEGLEKELKALKDQNGRLFDKAEEAHVGQAEMAQDIKWIVDSIKNGGK